MYGFHYQENRQLTEKFNRSLTVKIEDLRSPLWRAGLSEMVHWKLLPRA
jgi:hypothetical protein